MRVDHTKFHLVPVCPLGLLDQQHQIDVAECRNARRCLPDYTNAPTGA